MCVFPRILVLLDCGPVDDAVMAKALPLASCGGSLLTLVHVVHSHTADQDRALKEKADACMKARMNQCAEEGVEARALLLSGEPEKALVDEIGGGNYDLVAMATHGHKFLSDILYGSVSDHLKHEVTVPLLLVNGKSK
jgi:nucleotide-binding universal stress UspA family protein